MIGSEPGSSNCKDWGEDCLFSLAGRQCALSFFKAAVWGQGLLLKQADAALCHCFQGWEGIYSSQGDRGLPWCLCRSVPTWPGVQTPVLTACAHAHARPRRSGCRSVRHVGRLLVWRCDKLRTADQERMCDDLIGERGERTAEERGGDMAEKGQRRG